MIKLKSLLSEGRRINQLKQQLDVLRKEWDRLDSVGSQSYKQKNIELKIEKLQRELTNWENLYKAANNVPNNINERNLSLDKKEDAAEFLIRQTWKNIPSGEDRYDIHDILLWIDNNRELSESAWKLSNRFYPNDDESWYIFQKDVKRKLEELELERLERRKSKTSSLKDPLYILKKSMVGKNWESAKRSIASTTIGWKNIGNKKINDEDIEQVF